MRTEEWLACIRRSGKTKCFILLSQCYAGVSNFIDANPSSGCQFCIVGATGLHYSISFSSKAQNILIKDNLNAVFRDDWAANIFFVSFFNWLVHPVDVDGDGKNTVLDAYRYAGVLSGQWLIEIKCAAVLDIHRRIPALYSILNDPLSDNLKKEQAFSEIRQITIFLSEPQEPWILHANFARNIVI